MKHHNPTPHQSRIKAVPAINRWLKHSLLGAILVGALTLSTSAQVTNSFTQTDTWDDYVGDATGGWLAPWVNQLGASSVLVAGVSNSTPLNGGGKYLNWSLTGGTQASTVRRPFAGAAAGGNIDITQPYTVEFDYRLDIWISNNIANFGVFNNSGDYIAIQQNAVGDTGNDVRGKGSFWVKAQGAANASQPGLAPKFWSFYEGNPATTTESLGFYVNSTNVPLATNVTYHFKFQIDPLPRLYEGTVSDGVNTFSTTAALGRKLRWRQYQPALPLTSDFNNSTMLAFIARANNVAENPIESLDNIVVYQNTNSWPPKFTQVAPVRAQTFYPASSNLVLNAVTYGTNSLPSSNVVLTLNGSIFTITNGLTLTGDDSTNNRTITYSGLAPNKTYDFSLSVADQSGRTSAVIPMFFDTFDTNAVTVIEAENFNFDPLSAGCSSLQSDTNGLTDRYIQNWVYSGQAFDNSIVNVTNGYYMRISTAEIDYHPTIGDLASNFRQCMGGVGIRNSASDDYERTAELWTDGITTLRENIMEKIGTNMWFNYTHEFPAGNYLVYLRAGSVLTNTTLVLDKVTSGYDTITQTLTNRGKFVIPAYVKKEILRNNPLVNDAGYTRIIPMSGKETLRWTCTGGAIASDNRCFANYLVFIPAPAIVISNPSMTGSDLSFSFNSIANVQYTVQYKNDVSSPTWSTLTTVVGNGNQLTVHDNPISSDNRLYRVVTN